MKPVYCLTTVGPVDKEFVRSHFKEQPSLYDLPCKFTIEYGFGMQSYYIEASNTHSGVMVLNWSSIAAPMRKEWDYVS